MDACVDGFECALEVEVDVGDDWDVDGGEDFFECFGIYALRDGDADDVCPGGDECRRLQVWWWALRLGVGRVGGRRIR